MLGVNLHLTLFAVPANSQRLPLYVRVCVCEYMSAAVGVLDTHTHTHT